MKKITNFLLSFSLAIFYFFYNVFLTLNNPRLDFTVFIFPLLLLILMIVCGAIIYARIERMTNNVLWVLILFSISLFLAKIIVPFQWFPAVIFVYALSNAFYIKVTK